MSSLQEPLRWLEHEVEKMDFGSIGISIVVHAGKISRIEKTVVSKKQQIQETRK